MLQTRVSESSYRSFLKHLFAALSDHLSNTANNGPTFSVCYRDILLYTKNGEVIYRRVYGDTLNNPPGASVAEWLESRTHDHLPLTAVGSNPVMGVRIFQVRKPPSWLAEGRWFYPGVDLGLISL